MAQRCQYRNPLNWAQATLGAGLLACASPAHAQDSGTCDTVKDCAQQMVVLANELKAENAALTERIAELEKALAEHAQTAAKALDDRIAAIGDGDKVIPAPKGNGESTLCPKDSVMVGAVWQSDPGGPHGIISWFGPVCRTMGKK